MKSTPGDSRAGFLYGAAAYGFWGLMPLYFLALKHVSAWELLTQRICWSSLLLIVLLTLTRGWKKLLAALRVPRTRHMLLATAILITGNWCCYIIAATTGEIVQASLGYFIAPLVNTALGVLALGERLRGLQKVAIALATIGVVIFAIMTQKIPGLAIGLAVSFGIYGLFRKTVAADALTGLATECIILTPFALSYLIWLQLHGAAKFGHFNQTTDLLLMAGGVVTVFPLYCFAQAARRLRLTTIGFLQFLAPTLQFALAITAGHEEFKVVNLLPFTFIWLAILIYTRDILRKSPL